MSSETVDRERSSIVPDLDSPDEEIRRLAVERVLALPVGEAIPMLVAALGDPSWRVRKAAVGRVVACPDVAVGVRALVDALADGENTGRRNSAVEALIAIGSKAIPILVEVLDSEDVDVRKLVVDTVAGIGDSSARDAIVGLLQDSDPNVRGAAADALGVLDGGPATDALKAVAVSASEDRLVRLSALRSLARLEVAMTPSELGSVLEDSVLCPAGLCLLGHADGEEASECLLKGLESGSRATREAAMESVLQVLGRTDGAQNDRLIEGIRNAARASGELLPSSIERLQDADLAMRLVLVQFLGLVGDGRAVVPILEAGKDEAIAEVAQRTLTAMGDVAEQAIDAGWSDFDADLRRDACALLARTEGRSGRLRLLSLLDDADGGLRTAAAHALGGRRCVDALPALVRRLEAAALEDDLEAEEELEALVDALVALARPDRGGDATVTGQAVELLTARLDGASEAVRLSIARVLGQIGRPEDSELVASLLKDPSAQVRRAAVEALSRLEPGMASEPLRLALADESPFVRIAAAAALGESENPKVLDDLRRLLHDEEPRVCAAALRSIGAYCAREGDPGSAEDAVALIDHALASDGMLAMAALEALRSIGGSTAASAALRALDRPEPEVVQAAVTCIAQHGATGEVTELIALVSHPSWGVRADVIQTLADRGVGSAVPSILRRLETEQDAFVRDTILRALKRLGA